MPTQEKLGVVILIVAGLVLSWMRALGEFGATVILAYHPYSLPVLSYVNLSSTGLTEALPLYRSAGYSEIPAYNDNPYSAHWLEKPLRRRSD